MNDWDINPSKYLTDSEGNFKLKADGTPRKKGGRPKGSKSRGYNYHSQTKAKIAASKLFNTYRLQSKNRTEHPSIPGTNLKKAS